VRDLARSSQNSRLYLESAHLLAVASEVPAGADRTVFPAGKLSCSYLLKKRTLGNSERSKSVGILKYCSTPLSTRLELVVCRSEREFLSCCRKQAKCAFQELNLQHLQILKFAFDRRATPFYIELQVRETQRAWKVRDVEFMAKVAHPAVHR
jgi:hypothetical protein